MYLPKHFEVNEVDTLYELIRSAPLGTLVTNTAEGLVANHIPFVLITTESELGLLRAHIPRANPLSEQLDDVTECLVIFHGPQGYVSPSWYATKEKDGKVVPTWNYCVAHVNGLITLVDDESWLTAQLQALTEQNETARSAPWAVADAPQDFTKRLVKSLVGLEVTIEQLRGKFKLSQNQPKENQASVLEAMAKERPDSELYALTKTVLEGD